LETCHAESIDLDVNRDEFQAVPSNIFLFITARLCAETTPINPLLNAYSVYGNGDMNAPAVKLLLIPRLMKTWDLVLQEVTEKISLRTGQAVRK